MLARTSGRLADASSSPGAQVILSMTRNAVEFDLSAICASSALPAFYTSPWRPT
jgi:hypothetical protein